MTYFKGFLLHGLTLLLFVSFQEGYAQNLNIGDKIPNVKLGVSNYPRAYVHLLSLKKKLIILDFWSHYCASCIKSFPKIDSLQRLYNDKIQIILVNKETDVQNALFFKRFKHITKPNVPFVAGDTVLENFFPHNSVPHHVWLDSLGKVLYTTNDYNLTKKNIDKVLADEKLPIKSFAKTEFIPNLFDAKHFESLEYFSYLSRCISGVDLSLAERKGYSAISFNCKTAVELIQVAFSESNSLDNKYNKIGRTILVTKDSTKYVKPGSTDSYDDWLSKFSYSYQLQIPERMNSKLYSIMKSDIMRVFELDIQVETQNTKSIVLTSIGGVSKIRTSGATQKYNFYQRNSLTDNADNNRYVINVPFKNFSLMLGRLLEKKFNVPFIDSTSIDENVDISLSSKAIDGMDLNLLKKELKIYGLDLTIKEFPLEVLIIKDK